MSVQIDVDNHGRIGDMGLVRFTFPLILLAFSASLPFPLLVPTRSLVARCLLLLSLLVISLVTRWLTSGLPGKFPTVLRRVQRAMTYLAVGGWAGLFNGLALRGGGGSNAVSKRGAFVEYSVCH